MTKIFAREMLLIAARAGYSFRVSCEGEVDYDGDQPLKAWDAVVACSDPMKVVIHKPGAKNEAMLVSAHDLAPDETIIDYSTGGFIDAEWEKLYAEAG